MEASVVRAAVIERTGGPEVIEWRDVELPPPGPGEIRLRQTAVGVNFLDTYHRTGLYPVAFPTGLGMEAVGVVEAVGEEAGLTIGQRVGTFGPTMGAYATARNLPAAQLLPIPDDIDDETAAAVLLKGCTVEFLVERCAKVQRGQTVLVHAAAGGVGLILVEWLKAAGATVIGTAGGEAKQAAAREAGADHVLDVGEDIAARVKAITGGAGVPVVFDGVGKATWDASLAAISPRGLLVSYGNASGAVTGVNLGILSTSGSLFVTRPTLYSYYATPDERAVGVGRLWEMLRSGAVKVTIGQRYRLEEAAEAHRDLEARKTTGSTVLLP